MKTTTAFALRTLHFVLALFLLSTLNRQLSTAVAQGTAFTYQGRLNDGGNPANGSYDLFSRLYDVPTGGSPLTIFPYIRPINVNNGIFTVTLDFGSAAFAGNAVYLELQVRTNGALNYTPLLPRQAITPAPYAIYAANAALANGQVDTPQLAGGAVTSAKVADGTLQPADLNLGNFERTFWKVGGNTGTSTDFIGTTDDQPFDIRVNNVRVMRYRLNADPGGSYSNAPNVIGGSSLNGTVTTDVVGATIAGGGGNQTNTLSGGFLSSPNRVTADFGAVGGGVDNTAGGVFSTVAGGADNAASGRFATVAGGFENTASGTGSFAAGQFASATHVGSFVWSDDSGLTSSASANSVTMRASGGFRFFTGDTAVGAKLGAGDTSWSSICDRNEKKNLSAINGETILEKLAALPVQSWNYKWEADTNPPHLGPMAQDFKAAFYPGRDDKSISTLEFDGVELAAIQGLNEKLEVRSERAEGRIQKAETGIQRLAEELKRRDAENAELKQRLDALEKIIRNQESN